MVHYTLYIQEMCIMYRVYATQGVSDCIWTFLTRRPGHLDSVRCRTVTHNLASHHIAGAVATTVCKAKKAVAHQAHLLYTCPITCL